MHRLLPRLLPLLACGGPAPKGDGAAAGAHPLGDGVVVQVEASGAFSIEVDGRRTLALAAPPFARRVDEQVEAQLGMWRFTRLAEEDVPTAALASVTPGDDGGLVITYATAEGPLEVALRAGAGRVDLEVHSSAEADALVIPVACDPGGSFHGFGEQYARTEHTGQAFRLFVSEQGIGRDPAGSWLLDGDAYTTYFPMPWFLDARGHGLLLQTDHRVQVDLCAADPAVATFEVMSGAPLQLALFTGPTPMDALRQLGDELGRPKAPPGWATGLWLCMQGGEDRVWEQVEAAEAAGLPATVLWVQDWTGRRENPGGGYGVQYRWEPDEDELYPGIAAFFAALKDRGYRVVGYVNPFVDRQLQHWDDLEAGGMLPLRPDSDEVYAFVGPRGDMTTVDLSHPGARAYITERLRAAVDEVGLDGWMADFAEWLPIDARLHDGSDAAAAHNRYPEAWQRITRELMDELRPDGDYLMFARSGWQGVQGVAMIHWAGDQEADFHAEDGLPTVVPALLSMGLSGQPFVTHDIAGFSGGPSTRELYLRWTELGAFTPYMRTHDGNERDANWRWDEDADTTAHFARLARVHEALRPLLAELTAEAAATGAPLVRHLMLEHPDDPETWPLSDQYLLGPDLLVAPVLTEGAGTRELYLPDGAWFHVWTGEAFAGPGWVTVDAPIGAPPVFHRGDDWPALREAADG